MQGTLLPTPDHASPPRSSIEWLLFGRSRYVLLCYGCAALVYPLLCVCYFKKTGPPVAGNVAIALMNVVNLNFGHTLCRRSVAERCGSFATPQQAATLCWIPWLSLVFATMNTVIPVVLSSMFGASSGALLLAHVAKERGPPGAWDVYDGIYNWFTFAWMGHLVVTWLWINSVYLRAGEQLALGLGADAICRRSADTEAFTLLRAMRHTGQEWK